MRVVATLTTRPNYHSGLKETLDSLTSQFDAVYLGLPYKSLKGIKYPEFSHPKVTVVRLEEDIGSSSKLLASLIKEKRVKDTLIVSVDDDYKYDQDLRKLFEKKREENIKKNKDYVITLAGFYVKYWNFGLLGVNGNRNDWKNNFLFDFNKEKKVTTIAGYAGVAYPANIFKETEDYINFIKSFKDDKILFKNDDILISAYISKLGIQKIIIPFNDTDTGKFNKDTNETIEPNAHEIYESIYKVKDYLQLNNPTKLTLVGLDLILILISFILIIFFLYYRNKKSI